MAIEFEIKAVLFDFGGVLAEEGFKEGLSVIAENNGHDPLKFLSAAFDIIYDIGFVLGKVRDDSFWAILRQHFPLKENDSALREEILSRFILRPWMLETVSDLKNHGIIVGILSDQCHWLDELDQGNDFFKFFDHIFNSYNMHISKRDPKVFDYASEKLDIAPNHILFIDDYEDNIIRAKQKGFQTILYLDKDSFIKQLKLAVYKDDKDNLKGFIRSFL